MKFSFPISASLVLLLFINAGLFSQSNKDFENKWKIGFKSGVSTHYSDINQKGYNFSDEISTSKFAYGIFIEKYINQNFSIQTSYLKSELSGSSNLVNNSQVEFNTPLTDLSIDLKYHFHNHSFSPFISFGAGFQLTDAVVNWYGIENGDILTDRNQIQNSHFTLPLGLGFNYNITNKLYIGTELSARKVFSDYIDGISLSGNPENQDWDGFATLNVGFILGKSKDSDNDGIIDRADNCPNIPGLKKFQGCPDSDNDGIQDKYDRCPLEFGRQLHEGCPDTDSDGFIDLEDNCPNEFGEINGCPDSDKDGLIDIIDDCPKEAGSEANKGCPDTDNDGIIDKIDLCPNEAGPEETDGCPIVDTDGDGVQDKNDLCPNKVGPVSNTGCPKSQKSKHEILKLIKVYFDDDASDLLREQVDKMLPFLTYLKRNEDAKILLKGYADFRGDEAYNLELSSNRNLTVREWFIEQGIPESRIRTLAIGEKETKEIIDLSLYRYVSIELEF